MIKGEVTQSGFGVLEHGEDSTFFELCAGLVAAAAGQDLDDVALLYVG